MKESLKFISYRIRFKKSMKENSAEWWRVVYTLVTSISKFIQEEAIHSKVVLKPLPVDPRWQITILVLLKTKKKTNKLYVNKSFKCL